MSNNSKNTRKPKVRALVKSAHATEIRPLEILEDQSYIINLGPQATDQQVYGFAKALGETMRRPGAIQVVNYPLQLIRVHSKPRRPVDLGFELANE